MAKRIRVGKPTRLRSVCSGESAIFLCQEGQGSRDKSHLPMTFGPHGHDRADNGVWISIWVEDVDVVHTHCLRQGLERAIPGSSVAPSQFRTGAVIDVERRPWSQRN